MHLRLALSLALISLPSLALAQPPGGGGGGGRGFRGGPFTYLAEESVQAELKLSDEAKKKAQELLDKQRAAFEELRGLSQEERRDKMQSLMTEIRAGFEKVLDAAQLKRLKEISYQVRGAQAFRDPEVAEALKLTDDQVSKLEEIENELREQMREVFQDAAGDREAAREEIEEIRKDSMAEATAVLTEAQQTTWKELQGAPFKGEIRERMGFGGGRRRGGGE